MIIKQITDDMETGLRRFKLMKSEYDEAVRNGFVVPLGKEKPFDMRDALVEASALLSSGKREMVEIWVRGYFPLR